MAALVCDICGGKLVMGSGGIAVCDSCGMEHSSDRMKEKVQEIKGVVQVDSSHLTENYMRMAQNAYDSGNKAEAENYCNKILEMIPTHQQAWLLKGRAAGWQSTLGNIRFVEAINCFANAVANTEEDEKESVIDACKQEVSELAEALIRLRGERFAKWPDADEKNGFAGDLTVILQAIVQFFNAVGAFIDTDELMAPLATIISNSVMDAWNHVVRPTFENDHDGYPSDYELKRLIDRADYCTALLEKAINLVDTDDIADIERYEDLITIHKYLINAQSYSYETVQVGNSNWDGRALYDNRYVESKSLNEAAKSGRRRLIAKYQHKINSIKSAAAAKLAKEFWDKYPEEERIISDAISRLEEERAKLTAADFNQLNLIETTVQELEEIQDKDRRSGERLSAQERAIISELANLWDKLADLAEEDARCAEEKARREQEKVNKFRKIKKIVIIASSIACAIIAFVISLNAIILNNKARTAMQEGNYSEAAIMFGKAGNYKQSTYLWAQITTRETISTKSQHTVGLKSNGTVVAVGNNFSGQCDVSGWTDIVAISSGGSHAVGLKSDGRVVATKYIGDSDYYSGQCDVSGWRNIVAISAGRDHTVGLQSDGRVVATKHIENIGSRDYGQCDVSGWTDIVAISARFHHTVGLRSDGTVVAVGDNDFGQCDVSDWTDIVAISAGAYHTVGLKSDGTVVATKIISEYNDHGECDVSGWTDIVAISAGMGNTVGLKSDGTVVAVGGNSAGECDVSGWTDIVAISAGWDLTIGLKSDGTVVATEHPESYNDYDDHFDVSGWTDIKTD